MLKRSAVQEQQLYFRLWCSVGEVLEVSADNLHIPVGGRR